MGWGKPVAKTAEKQRRRSRRRRSEARKRRAEVCQPFLLKREPTESESYVHEAGAAPGVVGVPDPDLALALLRDRRGVVHRASGHTPSDPPPLRV